MRILLIAVIACLFCACDVINPSEQVPSYIHVESVDFVAGVDQGTSDMEITDVYVLVDNNSIGVYELPATVPILAEGKRNISLVPGIKLHRINGTRAINPFYSSINYNMELVPAKIDTLFPESSYNGNADFIWNEDFELAGHTLDQSTLSPTDWELITEPENVYEGSRSIGFKLDATNDRFFGQSRVSAAFQVPASGTVVLMEVHYKSNVAFNINIKNEEAFSGVQQEYPHLRLNASDTWKKVYLNFSPFMTIFQQGTKFWITFAAQLEDGVTEGEVFLDNIKMIQ